MSIGRCRDSGTLLVTTTDPGPSTVESSTDSDKLSTSTPSGHAGGRSRLAAVDGLRAFAALWVVLFHIRAFSGGRLPPGLDTFARSGSTGVSLFLVLSGFCLFLPYSGGRSHRFQSRSFFRRRRLSGRRRPTTPRSRSSPDHSDGPHFRPGGPGAAERLEPGPTDRSPCRARAAVLSQHLLRPQRRLLVPRSQVGLDRRCPC